MAQDDTAVATAFGEGLHPDAALVDIHAKEATGQKRYAESCLYALRDQGDGTDLV